MGKSIIFLFLVSILFHAIGTLSCNSGDGADDANNNNNNSDDDDDNEGPTPFPGPCFQKIDSDDDGEFDSRIDFEYDEDGNQIEQHYDKDNDGKVDSIVYQSFYKDGKIKKIEEDRDLDDSPDNIQTFKYDENGMLSEYTHDLGGDDEIDYHELYKHTFDDDDLLVEKEEKKKDGECLGIYFYDNNKAGLLKHTEFDQGCDESINRIWDYTWDESERLAVEDDDVNADGSADHRRTHRYDDNGRLIKLTTDNLEDGQATSTATLTHKYDDNGNVLEDRYDLGDDGVVEELTVYNYDCWE